MGFPISKGITEFGNSSSDANIQYGNEEYTKGQNISRSHNKPEDDKTPSTTISTPLLKDSVFLAAPAVSEDLSVAVITRSTNNLAICTSGPDSNALTVKNNVYTKEPKEKCHECSRKTCNLASISFKIKTIFGDLYKIKGRETDTLLYLAFKIGAKTGIPPDRQRLTVGTKELNCTDDTTLKECGIYDGCIVNLLPLMTTGFLTTSRLIGRIHINEELPIEAEESPHIFKRREAQWWKEKQEEHDGMRLKMKLVRQQMNEKKEKKTHRQI